MRVFWKLRCVRHHSYREYRPESPRTAPRRIYHREHRPESPRPASTRDRHRQHRLKAPGPLRSRASLRASARSLRSLACSAYVVVLPEAARPLSFPPRGWTGQRDPCGWTNRRTLAHKPATPSPADCAPRRSFHSLLWCSSLARVARARRGAGLYPATAVISFILLHEGCYRLPHFVSFA